MSEAEEKSTPQRVPVLSKQLKLIGDGTQGVLLGMVCKSCGTHFFGSPRFCLKCTSSDIERVELSKEGVLYSFTIVRAPPPGWQGSVPYILGSVKLPEGPQVRSEVVDCPEEAIWEEELDIPDVYWADDIRGIEHPELRQDFQRYLKVHHSTVGNS